MPLAAVTLASHQLSRLDTLSPTEDKDNSSSVTIRLSTPPPVHNAARGSFPTMPVASVTALLWACLSLVSRGRSPPGGVRGRQVSSRAAVPDSFSPDSPRLSGMRASPVSPRVPAFPGPVTTRAWRGLSTPASHVLRYRLPRQGRGPLIRWVRPRPRQCLSSQTWSSRPDRPGRCANGRLAATGTKTT